MLREEQENNTEMLENLEHEIARLTRKDLIHEKAFVEQVENIERRIEYEEVKNRKIRDQIAVEQTKIDKIKDKYKDRHVQMEEKLEEINKDLKFAQMLMKTYVDQIAREKQKLELVEGGKGESGDMFLNDSQGNKENHGFKKLNTRGSSIASKMLTIRNNEGKVCA
jgi:hypothetical protein